ncbi:cell wall-binding repeat-containing protein [Euzebya tangerina]|uniref:cell wall-binding repeat-containing protein n=1 Tax=Euzebya tangerina TaxID=591198 RepID=UPI000E31642C|nr:cell wall-binding repeat-containing protein [Euzebya tangerina]
MVRVRVLLVSCLIAVLALPGTTAVGQEDSPFGEDTAAVGLGESATPNIDVAVELSRATFAEGSVDTVLIGRSDVFADSLSSGLAQSDGPLLLVPTDGPIPAEVRDEIERLGASAAVIFGGEVAVSEAVADELSDLGLTVSRVSGVSRTETAVSTASTLQPDATTAVLARSGGVEGNPTSAFADTLGAGALAAIRGWPVLLTQTEVLTGSTRDYLTSSGITEVVIVGGTAAVSAEVEQQVADLSIAVRRLEGPDRAATAIAIAAELGFDTAAATDEVIVVDGFSDDAWAAGFAAAARAFVLGTPIVLGNIDSLPPATEGYLEEGPEAITCAVAAVVCDAARVELGFAPAVALPTPAGTFTFAVSDGDSSLVWGAAFDGSDSGLRATCRPDGCPLLDWTGDSTRLYGLLPTGERTVRYAFDVQADGTLGADPGDDSDAGGRETFLDAFGGDGAQSAVFIPSLGAGGVFRTAGGVRSGFGSGFRGASPVSFQAYEPHAANANVNEGLLAETSDGGLRVDARQAGAFDAQIQRRSGAAIIGAALNPNGDGAIALTDEIANTGVLRIATYPEGDTVEVEGLDVNSPPYWLPDGETVVVLADVADAVALVAVDAGSGELEVLVDDAGDAAAGQRIESDGSGTLIGWRVGDEAIRVLNTGDGTVAELTPPEGYAVTGGPAVRQ